MLAVLHLHLWWFYFNWSSPKSSICWRWQNPYQKSENIEKMWCFDLNFHFFSRYFARFQPKMSWIRYVSWMSSKCIALFWLLSTKAWKVAEDTVSVRNKILSTNLSRWGDAKSKAKVKKKFPENFGALYPGEIGPLGERLLKVTFQCYEQVWWCSGNSNQYVHSFNSNFQETLIYRVWLPFSQWLG